MLSYGDIYIASGAQSQALSTTAALLAQFSASGGANGTSYDNAIQPDKANNRVKVLPGRYFVDAMVELTPDAECDITLRVRKNSVAITGILATVPAQQIVKTFTPSLTPAAISQGTCAEQGLTVTGLLTTDKILNIVKPTAQAGLGIVGARISAADTLQITFANVPNAGGNITPTAAQTYQVIVGRFGKSILRAFGFVSVEPSDAPGTLEVFSVSGGSGFVGPSGSPKTLVPIDLTLESSTGTPNVTISAARLALTRIK